MAEYRQKLYTKTKMPAIRVGKVDESLDSY